MGRDIKSAWSWSGLPEGGEHGPREGDDLLVGRQRARRRAGLHPLGLRVE